jgi:cell division protein FtsQ
MQQMNPAPHDPAPSRMSYRLNRLWLTPTFRALLRTGLPAVSVLALVVWYLSDEARVDAALAQVAELRASVEQRPEFMVNLMRIENVSAELAEDIREVTSIDFPISSFDLDLAARRASIEELDAVAAVRLVIRQGGVLDVEVVERRPAIVWRGREGLELLDEHGHRVASVDRRSERDDLPLIAGDGADRAVPEALELVATAAPEAARLRGLLRVGERRWDVILDRGLRIMLPETGAVAALERALALDEIEELLSRDLVAVDLRDSRRPTLRLTPNAVEFLQSIYNPDDGDGAL